jgi:hypothetical protein
VVEEEEEEQERRLGEDGGEGRDGELPTYRCVFVVVCIVLGNDNGVRAID